MSDKPEVKSDVKTYITFKTIPEFNCSVYNPDWHNLVILKSDYDQKVKLLEAALEVAKEGQVGMYHAEWSGGEADTEKFRIELNKEIEAILNPKPQTEGEI
jgi:hypothetical protein